MKKKTIILFLAILLIGGIIRLYDPAFRSLWGDEAHSIYSALHFSYDNLLHDSHFPLYFLLLSIWIKIFGCTEFVLRSFSILIGVVSLFVFFLITRDWFDDDISLIALLLMATSPLAIMHSQEIRMYGLLMMFSMLSCWTFWKLAKKPSILDFGWYFIATILLLLTHIYACLIFLCQIIYALYLAIYKKKGLKILSLQSLIAILVAPLFIRILNLNLMALMQGIPDMAFSVFPGYLKFILIYFVLTLGETMAPWHFLVAIPAGLIVLALLLLGLQDIKKHDLIGFLWLASLVPILIAAFILKPTMPKFLISALPFFLLLLAIGLKNISSLSLRYFLLAVLVICQLASVKNYFSLAEYHNSNQIEPWRSVAALIKQEQQPKDIVLASNHFVVNHLLNYYLNLANHANMPIFDLEIEKADLDNKNIQRIWFVTNIHDDRQFPPGYIERVKAKIGNRYRLISTNKYIPYEATLVSKLPINRHEDGSYRICLELYERR